MLTARGWAAVAAGLSLWVVSRLVGAPDLHILAAGVLALPVLAVLFVRWSRVRLGIRRRLSSPRVFAGGRLEAELTVENLGHLTTSFLLLEDAVPQRVGRSARLVVSGIPPRNHQTVSYSITCRHRGRFTLGPLTIHASDPFGLARTSLRTAGTSDLVVYPRVEDLDVTRLLSQGVGAGESTARQLHRSAADFYTMREYVTGDDLRRIHWPSVARTGQLMIRQDESTRRSTATVLLDNRAEAFGAGGAQAFERAVSVAASLGRAFLRRGFTVHLATADGPPRPVTEQALLDALAAVQPARTRGTGEMLRALRAGSLADTSLAVVTSPPSGADLAAISRAGTAFGRRLAVLVYPVAPGSLGAPAAEELRRRASRAHEALNRAGWEVFVIPPDRRLSEAWQTRATSVPTAAASSP